MIEGIFSFDCELINDLDNFDCGGDYPGCQNISYKNITLDTYVGFVVGGLDLTTHVASNITLENITAINNQEPTYALVAHYINGLTIKNVSVARGETTSGNYTCTFQADDTWNYQGLTIHDAGVGKPYQLVSLTNVTGQDSIVVV